jgi:hypothetical protein
MGSKEQRKKSVSVPSQALCVLRGGESFTVTLRPGETGFSAFSGFVCSARSSRPCSPGDTPGVSVPSQALCVLRVVAPVAVDASSGSEIERFQCLLRLCVFCEQLWLRWEQFWLGGRVSVPSQALCVLRGASAASTSSSGVCRVSSFSAFSGFVCSARAPFGGQKCPVRPKTAHFRPFLTISRPLAGLL